MDGVALCLRGRPVVAEALWAIVLQAPVYGEPSQSDAKSSAVSAGQVNSDGKEEQAVPITGVPPIIVVSGSNYEMGYQYGQQAAARIYQNKVLMNKLLEAKFGKATVANDLKVWTYFLEKHDRKLKDWLNGISAGCKSKRYNVSFSDLVLNMVYPQELWARPKDPYPKGTGVAKKKSPKVEGSEPHMCSAFGATGTATPDGKPILWDERARIARLSSGWLRQGTKGYGSLQDGVLAVALSLVNLAFVSNRDETTAIRR